MFDGHMCLTVAAFHCASDVCLQCQLDETTSPGCRSQMCSAVHVCCSSPVIVDCLFKMKAVYTDQQACSSSKGSTPPCSCMGVFTSAHTPPRLNALLLKVTKCIKMHPNSIWDR